MRPITRLPSRPLRRQDLATLEDAPLQVVPYGGVAEESEVHIYAIKIATGDTAHALGFDDSRGQWQQLTSIDADNLVTADSQLDIVLDEWVQDRYGGRFEVLKTV